MALEKIRNRVVTREALGTCFPFGINSKIVVNALQCRAQACNIPAHQEHVPWLFLNSKSVLSSL
jgi:hypothetical protein